MKNYKIEDRQTEQQTNIEDLPIKASPPELKNALPLFDMNIEKSLQQQILKILLLKKTLMITVLAENCNTPDRGDNT